jgi:shikimate 5-dehydrogenase
LAGAASIELVCVEPTQATPLIESLKSDPQTSAVDCRVTPWPKGSEIAVGGDVRLLLNATPVGRYDGKAQLPINVEGLRAESLVCDMTFNPPTTRLMRDARKRALPTVDGLTLLVEQASVAFELWTGQKPDREAMREAVEEFLVL